MRRRLLLFLSSFMVETPCRRPRKLHLPAAPLPPGDTCVKQTKAARVVRRAQAVRHIVPGPRRHTGSAAGFDHRIGHFAALRPQRIERITFRRG